MSNCRRKMDLARAMEIVALGIPPRHGCFTRDEHREAEGFLAGYTAGQIDMRQRAADLSHSHSCRPGCVCPEGIAGDIHILPLSPENISEGERK